MIGLLYHDSASTHKDCCIKCEKGKKEWVIIWQSSRIMPVCQEGSLQAYVPYDNQLIGSSRDGLKESKWAWREEFRGQSNKWWIYSWTLAMNDNSL